MLSDTTALLRHHSAQTNNAHPQADAQDGFISKNQDFFRSLPVVAGGSGFLGLLANRFWSDVAPFVDASSSQSRVDVVVIGMAATLALTGFQWLVLKPVEPKQVCHSLHICPPAPPSARYRKNSLPTGENHRQRCELLPAWFEACAEKGDHLGLGVHQELHVLPIHHDHVLRRLSVSSRIDT